MQQHWPVMLAENHSQPNATGVWSLHVSPAQQTSQGTWRGKLIITSQESGSPDKEREEVLGDATIRPRRESGMVQSPGQPGRPLLGRATWQVLVPRLDETACRLSSPVNLVEL
jgi:hypothetical protein